MLRPSYSSSLPESSSFTAPNSSSVATPETHKRPFWAYTFGALRTLESSQHLLFHTCLGSQRDVLNLQISLARRHGQKGMQHSTVP